MKFLTIISQWFSAVRMRFKQSKEARYQVKLNNHSCEAINVIEFDGRLYIAFEGIPVVRVDDIKVKAPDLLAQARADYLAWNAKFDK